MTRPDRFPAAPLLARALALLLAWPLPGAAAPLAVGDALQPLQFTDQHDRPVLVQAQTRVVIFSAEKSVSEMVTQVLSAEPADTLERLGAVYVSDISGMPGFITQAFALPRLRQLPYSTALARSAEAAADFPREPGRATVLGLQDGTVTTVAHVADAASLRRALGLAAR